MSRSDVELPTRAGHRAATPKRWRSCGAVLVALVIVLGGGYFVLDKGIDFLSSLNESAQDYSGPGSGSVVVEIPEGATLADMAQVLEKKDVVASAEAFTNAATENPDATSIQAGFYDMRQQMSATSAIELLLSGENRVESVVTVPEGLTVGQTIDVLSKETEISRAAYERAAKRPDSLGLPDYANGDLEGYLFPATYTLPPKTSATDVLSMMVEQFWTVAQDIDLEARAQEGNLDPHDVVTVASIVQREARRAEDFPKVARVIYNRLNAGMPLQMDSTVHYATGTAGDVFTTDEQRAFESPYNTYVNAGLPPGAIAAGGEAALEASLAPAEGDWLYFVTVNLETGETRFASTLAEHNQNRALLDEYCDTSDLCS